MKGSVMDMIGVLVLFIAGAMTLFCTFYLLGSLKTELLGIPMFSTNTAAMNTIDSGINTLKGMDGLLAFFVFMVCVVAIISAFMLPTHPVMFIIAIFLVIILIPVSATFANMFEAMYAAGSPLAGTEVNFPITVLILNWLPKITEIMGFIIGAVMYAGKGGGGY